MAFSTRLISNTNGTDFIEVNHDLDHEETLLTVSLKTFKTMETITNAHAARACSLATLKQPAVVARHFIAVSSNLKEAVEFGIGPDYFQAMLAGFHKMDEHFRTAAFEQNHSYAWSF